MPENQNQPRCGIEVAMRTSQTHRRELIQALEGLRTRIGDSDGVYECEVFEDLAEPNRFLWSEWWPTPELRADARESDRFRTLIGAVKVLGTLESIRSVERSAGGSGSKEPNDENGPARKGRQWRTS